MIQSVELVHAGKLSHMPALWLLNYVFVLHVFYIYLFGLLFLSTPTSTIWLIRLSETCGWPYMAFWGRVCMQMSLNMDEQMDGEQVKCIIL